MADCGVKVKVRENRETGVVQAFYAAIDESWELKIAEVHRNIFDGDPDRGKKDGTSRYDRWLAILSEGLTDTLLEVADKHGMGVKREDFSHHKIRLEDKN